MCCGASYGAPVNYSAPGTAPYVHRGSGPRYWEVTARGTGALSYVGSEIEAQTLTASGGGVRELSPPEIEALKAKGLIPASP